MIRALGTIGGFFNAGVIGYLITKPTPITKWEMVWFGLAVFSAVFECCYAVANQIDDGDDEDGTQPN